MRIMRSRVLVGLYIAGQPYSLTFRFYRPKGAVADHTYFPPPLTEL